MFDMYSCFNGTVYGKKAGASPSFCGIKQLGMFLVPAGIGMLVYHWA